MGCSIYWGCEVLPSADMGIESKSDQKRHERASRIRDSPRPLRDRQLAQNPARGVTLPRKSKKPHVYLTHDQVWKLADASGENAAIVLLLAYTGLRWGEAIALRLKHLNTLRRRLNISENAVTYGPVAFVGTRKNHEARSVPYLRFLSEPIALLCEGKQPWDLVLGDGLVHLRRPQYIPEPNVVGYPGYSRGRPRVDDSPRSSAHGREPRGIGSREGESRAADARTRVHRDPSRHLRRPVR